MRVMFLYLGRRGSLGQFTLQLAKAAAEFDDLDATFTVARSRGIASRLADFGAVVFTLDTYEKWPILSIIANFIAARARFLAELARDPPAAVVTLMPHIWTPLLAPGVKQLGIRYISIAHDAVSHPGDPTALLTPWLLRDAQLADSVITLSRTVADRLVSSHRVPSERILSLFHPDLSYGDASDLRPRIRDAPLRLLFFGRIMKYKGLPLLIDAIEMLRAEGVDVHLGVAGDGNVDDVRYRLARLGAELINRWIEDDEVAPLLARYDAIALSHIEASQSGVAATAFGSYLPVVGTPVGGIAEQIVEGRTGVLAQRSTARSLAEAIRRLATDHSLYDAISHNLWATAETRCMRRFLGDIVNEVGRIAEVDSK